MATITALAKIFPLKVSAIRKVAWLDEILIQQKFLHIRCNNIMAQYM